MNSGFKFLSFLLQTKRIELFSLFFLSVGITCLCSQSLEQELELAMQENYIIGATVLSICQDQPAQIFNFGYSDLSGNIEVSESTYFRIASISKLVSSIGLLKLCEEGYCDIDEPINNYLPYEVKNPNYPNIDITLRMLLSHTSTLNDGQAYSSFLNATYSEMPPPDISEILVPGGSFYYNDIFINRTPGEYFQYANINYGLVATIIEFISEVRFDIYMKELLFDPLDIDGSYNIQDLQNIQNLAVLYRDGIPQADNYGGTMPEPPEYSSYEIGTNGSLFAPQGGLRISASDLSKIMFALINNGIGLNDDFESVNILDAATVINMLDNNWSYNGSNGNNYYDLFNSWGLGVHRITNTNQGDIVFQDIPMFGHPGEAYGLLSDLYFDLESGYGLIFITNGYYPGGNYQFGENSAFYQVEEDVFNILKNYSFDLCANLSSDTPKYNIHVYPNPTNNFIYFNQSDWTSFTIRDLSGRIVLHQCDTINKISVSNLNSGIYFYEIIKHEQRSTGKVIIE